MSDFFTFLFLIQVIGLANVSMSKSSQSEQSQMEETGNVLTLTQDVQEVNDSFSETKIKLDFDEDLTSISLDGETVREKLTKYSGRDFFQII